MSGRGPTRWLAAMLLALVVDAPGASELLDWRSVVAKGADGTDGGEEWSITSGSFVIDSEMPFEPMVTCHFAHPTVKGKRRSPRANHAVYYFHTPNPKNANVIDNGICNQFVTQLGMTVFAISFQQSSDFGLFFGNQEAQGRSYVNARSGSFKTILSAWAALRRGMDIEATRFYVYGYSAGGIGAQRFAEEFPEFCAGFVSVNGHSFIQKNGAQCPGLILHAYGDLGLRIGDGLFDYYHRLGSPVVRHLFSPSWAGLKQGNDGAFHAVDASANVLGLSFLRGLSQLRAQDKADRVPPPAAWPYAIALEDPQQIAAISGAGAWSSPIERLGLTAMPIPSANFYAKLLQCPPPPLRLKTGGGDAFLARSRLDQPPARTLNLVTPAGALADGNGFARPAFTAMQFFAEHGYHVVAADGGPALAAGLGNLGRHAAQLANLPDGLLLLEPTPEDLGLARSCTRSRRLALILSTRIDLMRYMERLQELSNQGFQLLVLLTSENQQEHDRALARIDPILRARIFPPFKPIGNNAALSQHHQHLDAVRDFMDRAAR